MSPSHPKGKVWIADVDGTSVGVIRISDYCEISITVAPEHRGKGHAKEMLRQACKQSTSPYLDAEIRATNVASQYVFEQCGFKMISCDGEFMQYRRIPT